MEVDGISNVKTCLEPVRDGISVKGQHSWPALNRDLGSSIEIFDFLFPVGFQYKRFIRPRIIWPIIDRIIRRAAGVGSLPSEYAGRSQE